jgi:hypothetical protein
MIRPKLGETGKGLGPVAEETGRSCSGFATMERVRVFRRGRQRWRSFGSANCLGQAWRWSNRDGPVSVRPQTVKRSERRRRRGCSSLLREQGAITAGFVKFAGGLKEKAALIRGRPCRGFRGIPGAIRNPSDSARKGQERQDPFESPKSERHLLGTMGLRVD